MAQKKGDGASRVQDEPGMELLLGGSEQPSRGLGAGAAVGPGGAPRPLERMLGRRHLAKVHSWREGVGVPHGGGPARQGPHCVCDPQGRAGRPWGPASILASEGHTD